MDRITERTYHRIAVREELDICVETPQDYDNLQHILSVLAAYEDAEQQGLLITLPCMIGDTVYVIAECEMVVSALFRSMTPSIFFLSSESRFRCFWIIRYECFTVATPSLVTSK